ncbi:hypothetical protein BGZ51_001859 [Haplosporangium sp. Z 767]|nr:hypothetical protein BGZ51_001859 [Haplosporangium sp. Z 767]KAF9187648.1 hypothetical protein BGZ50_001796 [Haplosporangium sp. Z 11]
MNQSGPSLTVVAHGAQNLKEVETLGKQDPYFRFSLDLNNPKSFQKTFVHKGAGKTATWNQSFTVPLAGEPEIFVEVMDDETTADAVIGFAAIPINQVVHAPGGTMNGVFDLYTPDGKQHGEVNLTLTAHNVPGQNTGVATQGMSPVKGTSHINEAHQKRAKSLKNRETAADVGSTAMGGLFAVGAGLLANKFANDNKKEEAARKEAELNAQMERERFEQEKQKLEQDRASFAQQQQQHQQQQQQQQFHQGVAQPHTQHQESRDVGGHGGHHEEKKYHGEKKDKHKKKHGGSGSDSSDSDSGSDSDDSYKKKDKKGKKWDSGGRSYKSGDKVKFDGRKYVCLQSHNSQSDWAPSVAHSLWKAK